MNKSIFGPIIIVGICILLTQSIAFAVSANDSLVLNYIALFTIGLQWIFFIHAGGFFGNERTEKYYDLMGSITFISTTIINSAISENKTHLVEKKVDVHFSKILDHCALQGVWVFITLLPLFIITQKEKNLQFKVLDYIGSILFICGFLCETIADYQKVKFRSETANKEKFIKSGLWKFSRHPNYFGEILLWFAFALVAFSGTQSYSVFISPVFVALLLIFVSGIPLLEKSADAKFGANDEYKNYKRYTPVLIPFVGRAGDAMF